MPEISFGTIGSILSRTLTILPGYFIRRKYNQRWLANHIKIDLRPRNEPVRILGGELPVVQIWLSVTNSTYFPVELDRLNLQFIYAALRVKNSHLKKIQLKSNETVDLYLEILLTQEQISYIEKNRTQPYVAIRIDAEFNSDLHQFCVETGELTGVNPTLVNFGQIQ